MAPHSPQGMHAATHSAARTVTRHRQRGSMAVPMLLMLLGLISMLGLVEVGYLYWAKRDAQKVADLAALAGAQRLSTCTSDNANNTAAQSNATSDNGFTGDLNITCGYWDPSVADTQHFTTTVDADHPRNAVRVQVTKSLTPFLGFAHFSGVKAQAIAANRGEPIASFSVGSRLLGLSSTGPLDQLLDSAIGTSLGLKLLSYEGIANGNLSLLGLKDALGINAGTVDGVLDAQVSLSDFLVATIQVLQQSGSLAGVDLSNAQTQIANIPIDVGSVLINLADILNVTANTNDPGKALDVDVNASDILRAAIEAANSKHAVALQALDIDIGLAQVDLKLAIVEPPKIGIGRPGYNPDGSPITVAHTAQVRLKLNVSLLSAVGNNGTLLNLPLLLNLSFPSGSLSSIPLNLELVPAEAWLDKLQCHVPNAATNTPENIVSLGVQPGALNLFLGNLPESTYGNEHQRWQDIVDAAIAGDSAYTDLVSLRLKLLLSLFQTDVTLQAYASAPVVRDNPGFHDFLVDPDVPIFQQTGMSWTLDTGQNLLGSALTAVVSPDVLHARLKLEGLGLAGNVVGALVNNLIPIVTGVLGTLGPVLLPMFEALDTALIGPLLRTLGADVGAADVNLMSVNCDTGAHLVY